MADYAHNASAREDRTRKATAIATTLYGALTPKIRNAICREAGVRPGSDETWCEAFHLLAERLAWDARHPDRKAG